MTEKAGFELALRYQVNLDESTSSNPYLSAPLQIFSRLINPLVKLDLAKILCNFYIK